MTLRLKTANLDLCLPLTACQRLPGHRNSVFQIICHSHFRMPLIGFATNRGEKKCGELPICRTSRFVARTSRRFNVMSCDKSVEKDACGTADLSHKPIFLVRVYYHIWHDTWLDMWHDMKRHDTGDRDTVRGRVAALSHVRQRHDLAHDLTQDLNYNTKYICNHEMYFCWTIDLQRETESPLCCTCDKPVCATNRHVSFSADLLHVHDMALTWKWHDTIHDMT
jgi:hypothetical protein